MARAGAPWAARAGVVRDRREAERHGAARDGRGLGGVALVGFRRDGMPGGRAHSRDFQLPDETRRRIRSGASSGAHGGGAQRHAAASRRRLARRTGLAPSSISILVVEGDNRPGLGHTIAKAVGDAGINMSFVMAQVVGRGYSAVFSFENEADASKAATLIKRATARGKK